MALSFDTVAIVGVGLIGGSIGRALRERSLCRHVVGIGRNPKNLADAVAVGAIDEGTIDLAQGVSNAEVVVVCTPVSLVGPTVREVAAHARSDVLITDAGSTKRTIVDDVERDPTAGARFVGAHPIAGSERSGALHADADLFVGRACILTPTGRTDPGLLERARGFWSSFGSRIHELDPQAHDEALALTSHLPHAVAATLAATVPIEMLPFAAGAYRDGTRVAGADPGLWAAIFHENRGPLLRAIDRFEAHLGALRRVLQDDDPDALAVWWESARRRRSQFRFDSTRRSADPESPAPQQH